MDYTFHATDLAVENIKKALEKRNTPNAFLRIGVRGGLCNGYGYVLEFSDDEPKARDLIFTFNDAKIVIDKKSIIFINGAELDWKKTLIHQGFQINNPNATTECGCKESFSV